MPLTKKNTFTLGSVTFKYAPKSKEFKVTVGDEVRYIRFQDLWMMIYMVSDQKNKDDLIPVLKNEIMVFARKHTIKATKDIKAGEIINCHCEVNVPKIVVESLLKEHGVEDPQSVMKRTEEESTPALSALTE